MSHKKAHPIVNKLKHAVRQNRLWVSKIYLDRKKEHKKVGLVYNDK